MNRSFKQQYTEQQNLQIGLANNWGYSLFSTNLDTKGKRQIISQAPKVANITLRQFNKDILKTDRIKQVQDQIKALHNQRRLIQENQRAAEAAINGQAPVSNQNKIMEWVDQKIREYNSIIQHRHLMKNNKNQAKNKVEVHKLENTVAVKISSDSMENRIADWAEKKFAQFMNSKDLTPINKKQSQQTKKNQDKQLSLPQEILKKIEQKKNQLLSTPSADLTHQISINRQISSLYRLFYNKNQVIATDQFRKTKSIAAQLPNSLDKHASDTYIDQGGNTKNRLRFLSSHVNNSASDYNLMGDVKNQRKNSIEISNEFKKNQAINKFKESEYKKYYTTNRKLSKDGFKQMTKGNRQKEIRAKSSIQKDLNQPFIQKKEVENYKLLQNRIRSNDQALELWKTKIQDVCNNSRVVKKMEYSSKIKQIQQVKAKNELLQREEQLEAVIGNNLQSYENQQGSNANNFLKEITEKNKKHEKQKQDIFAELLRKRHNKFNKLWGTKILVKYDCRGEAKQMLKGDAQKKPQDQSLTERGYKTSRSANSPTVMRATEKDFASIQANMMHEQNDDQHYWRMCKNQKINLLLKRR